MATALTSAQLIIKKLKFVLLTCLLPFLATKGSRVLEKKVNETEVSKTVFRNYFVLLFYRSVYIVKLEEKTKDNYFRALMPQCSFEQNHTGNLF